MNLRIFTGVWGNYVDTFERGVATSLNWPLNREAIKGANWNIVTERKNFERVSEIRERCGVFKGENIELFPGEHPTLQFSARLYEEMKKCIEEKATYLFALPDYIFGDGTIQNLKAMMTEPGLCLAVPNTRVLPAAMEYFGKPLTNAELVSLAFDKTLMHQTWREAEIGKPTINSFYGGVSWKELSPGLIAVTHLLPSSYMCQFIESDIEYFKSKSSFSAWDHEWPVKLLKERRQRYVSSSDVAFITEITEADKNLSPVTPVSPEGPTAFFRYLYHNKANKSVSIAFRKADS